MKWNDKDISRKTILRLAREHNLIPGIGIPNASSARSLTYTIVFFKLSMAVDNNTLFGGLNE
jgi:hypothetical protein